MRSLATNNTPMMLRIFTILVAALVVAPGVGGHSWVEQMRNLDTSGNYVGQIGYPRGMIVGQKPGVPGDPMVHKLESLDANSPACHPDQQKPVQSEDKYPRLKVVPGGFISMRYRENGHVTLNQRPGQRSPEQGSGTVHIFGTTEPQEDEKLGTILQWSKDGKGGNSKGVKLAAMDFNDGRCYQLAADGSQRQKDRQKATPNWVPGQKAAEPGGNAELLCESNVKIPESAEEGKPYTLYWVWQWPTILPAPAGKDEYYTTCMDVDVTSEDVAHTTKVNPPPFDTMNKAPDNWASRTAQVDDVVGWEMGDFFKNLPKAPTSGDDSKPDAPVQSKVLAPSPSPSSATVDYAQPSGPVIPTLTGRPGTAKPSPKPSPKPTSSAAAPEDSDDDDQEMVTITDTIYVTVTAGDDEPSSSAIDDKREVTTTATPSPTPSTLVTLKSSQQAPAPAVPSKLPGFNMGGSAKFRGMFT